MNSSCEVLLLERLDANGRGCFSSTELEHCGDSDGVIGRFMRGQMHNSSFGSVSLERGRWIQRVQGAALYAPAAVAVFDECVHSVCSNDAADEQRHRGCGRLASICLEGYALDEDRCAYYSEDEAAGGGCASTCGEIAEHHRNHADVNDTPCHEIQHHYTFTVGCCSFFNSTHLENDIDGDHPLP